MITINMLETCFWDSLFISKICATKHHSSHNFKWIRFG